MSFSLYDDEIISSLIRSAQAVANKAAAVATKLGDALMDELSQMQGGKDNQVFVQDLVDLGHFLNFIQKNQLRYGDFLIAYHEAALPTDIPNKADYKQYKDFYVLVPGLFQELRALDQKSQQPKGEIIKPFIKHLSAEIEQVFGVKYDMGHDVNKTPANPKGGNPTVGFGLGQEAIDTALGKDKKEEKGITGKTTPEQDMATIKNALPFAGTKFLSPYNMYAFVSNMNKLLTKNTQMVDTPLITEFQENGKAISEQYNAWVQLTRETKERYKNGTANTVAQTVPYDLSGNPHTVLTRIFGDTANGSKASQLLLNMVNVMEQTFLAIQQSPSFLHLIGAEVINRQDELAKAFIRSLEVQAQGA